MNTQIQNKVVHLHNPLEDYLTISNQIKELESKKNNLRARILELLDESKVDALAYGQFKAKRDLVIQKKIDSDKVKALLGDQLHKVQSESAFIKLTVI